MNCRNLRSPVPPSRWLSLQISSRAIAILFKILALNLNNNSAPALLSAFFCSFDRGDRGIAVDSRQLALSDLPRAKSRGVEEWTACAERLAPSEVEGSRRVDSLRAREVEELLRQGNQTVSAMGYRLYS
ncbi:hypothetical protein [Microcoleus sp. bin38.metabat.b11b12b14.051]|uniref:hypothetical protein n=1 Tax=Microcoleus sp. bin38.metabat.b11b12b14.051 TaxID=2742709 RepID=UPI0025EC3A4B|nr:hypothetical protein [Microcoleus sp. bin38.metabat.b11b12b14.051]